MLAVAGRDATGETSSVSDLYASEFTSGALIAKTGTIRPTIALAGLASSKEGDIYFAILYGIDGSAADRTRARSLIRSQVNQTFANSGGKNEINYTYEKFISFDRRTITP